MYLRIFIIPYLIPIMKFRNIKSVKLKGIKNVMGEILTSNDILSADNWATTKLERFPAWDSSDIYFFKSYVFIYIYIYI